MGTAIFGDFSAVDAAGRLGRFSDTERAGMTDTQSVGLSKEQAELVLRGLRFVRSAISMELMEYTDEAASKRSRQLREVDSLVRQLGGKGERIPAGV